MDGDVHAGTNDPPYQVVGAALGACDGAWVCGMPKGPDGSCKMARTTNMTAIALTAMMWNGKAGMCRMSFAVILVSALAFGKAKYFPRPALAILLLK